MDAPDFWQRVEIRGAEDCWLWTGTQRGNAGHMYGSIYFRGKNMSAHRVSWVIANGEMPKFGDADYRGTCVLHKCDTPLCVNPNHLEVGSHKANMVDKVAKRRDTTKWKTHCSRGHERNEVNTWVDPKRGLKHCRVCHKLKERERKLLAKQKEQRTF